MTFSRIKYTGSTPGADTDTYNLYDSTENGVEGLFALAGLKKFVVDIKHDTAGTLKWYKSNDKGVSWEQIGEEAIGIPAATATTYKEYTVEPYLHWKIDWVNGGSAQSPWDVDMALHGERAAAS